MTKLSVIVPAYDEEKTIGSVLEKVKNTLKSMDYEIIVVDDGSTDKTSEIAKRQGVKVITNRVNMGVGFSIQNGFREIGKNTDIVVQLDGDGQHDPSEIQTLIKPILTNEADVVIGSRFLGSHAKMPWIKKTGNKVFSRLISLICGVKITDSQSGFRAMRKEFVNEYHCHG